MGSPAVRPDDQYGQLLDRLVDRMADIAAATARAVRASIPAYDKVWDVVGPAVERVVLETNLHLVDMWRTGYRPDAEQLARLGRIGLPRAELGISIEEVLRRTGSLPKPSSRRSVRSARPTVTSTRSDCSTPRSPRSSSSTT